MRPAIVAVGMAVAGCSATKPDLTASRLQPGDRAIVVSAKEDQVFLVIRPDDMLNMGEFLAVGTTIQCEADAEEPDLRTPFASEIENGEAAPAAKEGDLPVPVAGRNVRVLVLDGPHKGRIGRLHRYNLRLVAK